MPFMSGAVPSPASPPHSPEETVAPASRSALRDPADDLFQELVVSNPRPARSRKWVQGSLIGHAIAIAALILVPILWPGEPPAHVDYIKALIYNPPPPPPPPLPKGSAMLEKAEPAKPVTPDPKPQKPDFTVDVPKEVPLKPEARDPESEQHGSPTGSDIGMAEGMEVGVEGGVVGGVPGGVIGGVIGGTGDGPVLDYDQPPRPIKITKPQYPQEAFVKKIEGIVEVEILIDASGNVARARVVQSIPALDQAALQTVYQWRFSPAIKNGRPVATVAWAPVTFRIF
jgi:periplasmic protein TonB